MLPTIELCEGCQKEYHIAFLTDDSVRLCAACYVELLKSELSRLKIKVAEQSQQRTQALGKLEDATKCDLCDDQAEYRQCQQCMNDKLVGSHTDEEWRQLKSKNAELKKYLKHARDDKKIRLGEIEGLEAKIVELRDELENRPSIKVADGDVWLGLGNALISIEGMCKFGIRGPIVRRNLKQWRDKILASKETTNENPQT